MAEEIKIEKDGSIKQVEMTSCGLNGGPLEGKGVYPASICCCLMPKEGNVFYNFFTWPWQKGKTCISQTGKDTDTVETQYVKQLQDGGLIGYKYFDFTKTSKVTLNLKGKAKGKIAVRYTEDGENVAEVEFNNSNKENFEVTLPINNKEAKSALYFYFKDMKGKVNFYNFELK